MPFLNLPILQHTLRSLARHGVGSVWMNAWHRAEQIEAFVASRPEPDLDIEVVVEPELLGTGGGLANVWQQMPRETTLVLVADVVADFDLDAFSEAHRARGAVASMALTDRADPERFGAVQQDPSGDLSDIVGLTGRGGGPPRVNASAHLFEPDFLDALPPVGPSCFVRQGYVPLMRAGERCAGWDHEGPWAETGNPDALLAAQAAALRGELPVDQGLLEAGGVRRGEALVHRAASVHAEARVEGTTTIAAGARVEADAELRDCLVLPDAVVSGPHEGEILGAPELADTPGVTS